jgi:hypothetical protein
MRKILFLVLFVFFLPAGCSSLSDSSTISKICDCSGNIYNCANFATTSEAQTCYDYCISQGKGDIHCLDADHDGLVCESGAAKTSSKKTFESKSSSNSGSCPAGKCFVNGYYRKSGTYVSGYCRKC